jgi:SAM-dependent methyltransferase
MDLDKMQKVEGCNHQRFQRGDALYGETGGQHPLAKLIDHRETYGPHIIERFVAQLTDVRSVVDIGAGSGRDLDIVKRLHPTAITTAIEAGAEYANNLRDKADHVHVVNIEREELPIPSDTIDLFIANQVLEHTKEVFWIFHEVSRCLRNGGHFIIGVPNVASLHNRLLLLFGEHPTQHKLSSAHVRPFSRNDTQKFLEACFPGGYETVGFGGAQFYPFPPRIARFLSDLFPAAAFSIFFVLKKKGVYQDQFATYPARAHLETNFYAGVIKTDSQY